MSRASSRGKVVRAAAFVINRSGRVVVLVASPQVNAKPAARRDVARGWLGQPRMNGTLSGLRIGRISGIQIAIDYSWISAVKALEPNVFVPADNIMVLP